MADDLFDVFETDIDSQRSFITSNVVTVKPETEKYCFKRGADSDDDDDDIATKRKKTLGLLDEINLDEYVPRIKIHTVDTIEACLHEVAIPPDAEYEPLKLPTLAPAKDYPFTLDPFQKEAILCIENNQSVLVSAHTSAGKTVVAEYAIASSLRDKQRVIYTTPIKALSNQKYREFYDNFKDVGLMTGDITINPSASCLIMTTEILRSMLYRGSSIMREVGWVIFDEIHYMRDKERGVVWEETIILLPDSVHYIFLSATIPNARQFAEWICHLHKQPCHVVYTDYRPVPLQHFIFPSGGDGLHVVVNEKGEFQEENFNMAMSVLMNAGDASKGSSQFGRKGGLKGETDCYKIVKMIMERNFAPVIVFSFNRKLCEAHSMQMAKLDFNNTQEKQLVQEVFNNAMDVLSDDDKKLPQVENILPLLKRGIGIHHSGLLPILKETIEILFSEGLIKALFATETFAMGLNMPARTVLFTSARKFDGRDFRWVTSGEYIQMSGRAGRRGIDEKGIVILMVDEKMSPTTCKDIVKGLPDPLNSSFHLTYNMVLNLLRVEEINPEFMLERSFYQFQNYSAIPQLYDRLKSLQDEYDSVYVDQEDDVSTYYNVRQQLDILQKEFQAVITKPQYIVPFLQPGRLVNVKSNTDDFGWGVIIFYKKKAPTKDDKPDLEPLYYVEALILINPDTVKSKLTSNLKPPAPGQKGEMHVVPIGLSLISQISAVRLHYPKDLRPLDNRMSVQKSINEVLRRFPDGVPLLDPVEDMGIKTKTFKDIITRINAFEKRLLSHPLHNSKILKDLYMLYEKKVALGETIKVAKTDLKKARSLLQMEELKCRKRVLRRMGYCTATDVIEVKGRVACEVDSGDELLLTEMIFSGIFTDLDVFQCAALLSCLVFEEKAKDMSNLSEELRGPLRLMREIAGRIARISNEAKLSINEEEYVGSFKPHMMDVIFMWAKGKSFAEICQKTEVFEGSIIRCMRRLEELLRQMCQASKAIGNSDLENKFSESIKLIKRDIVFAASLYL